MELNFFYPIPGVPPLVNEMLARESMAVPSCSAKETTPLYRFHQQRGNLTP